MNSITDIISKATANSITLNIDNVVVYPYFVVSNPLRILGVYAEDPSKPYSKLINEITMCFELGSFSYLMLSYMNVIEMHLKTGRHNILFTNPDAPHIDIM